MQGSVVIASASDFASRMGQLDREELTKKRERSNFHFVQVSKGSLAALTQLAVRSPTAVAVLLMMSKRMSPLNAVLVDVAEFATLTNRGRSAVYEALALLRSENWVQQGEKSGANYYLVNSQVFWSNTRQLRVFSFSAPLALPEESCKDTAKGNEPCAQIFVPMTPARPVSKKK